MAAENRYRSTESKFKGGAREMYVTYDIKRETRSGTSAVIPKVKRVYIAGDVKGWKTGEAKNRTGREVHGLTIRYEQDRSGFERREFTAHRGTNTYKVKPSTVGKTAQKFTKVVEIPEDAQRVHFYKDAEKLPSKYKSALQNIR